MKILSCLALLALAGCGVDPDRLAAAGSHFQRAGASFQAAGAYAAPAPMPAIATPIGGGSYVVNQGPRHAVCNTVTGGVVICQ